MDAEHFCLVIGDAPGKKDDILEFWKLNPAPHAVCCVNRAGLWYPGGFQFWVSFHADQLVGWARQRPCAELWSVREHLGVTTWPVNFGHGTSSMIAVQYALDAWKFSRAVIIGVHLDGAYEDFRSGWSAMVNNHAPRIRAIGGYTEQLFGRPDAAFVGGV